jgi:hypothetical protein
MIVANKPWPHTGSFVAHLHKIVVKLKKAMEIPFGYQDKNGFHLGPEHAEKEIKGSSFGNPEGKMLNSAHCHGTDDRDDEGPDCTA